MKLPGIATLALAALALSAVAPAQSLKERAAIEHDKSQLPDIAKRLNTTCGTSIVVTVDYASYSAAGGVNTVSHAPSLLCQNATDAIDLACRHSAAGKQAVQSKISKVVCSYSATETESLSGKDFHYGTPYQGGTPDAVSKWLDANL